MPDPVAAAAELPAGAGVVFRHFGRPDAESVATALARLAREKPLTLLIGDDVGLALSVGAGGVHLPERGLSAAVVRMCRHRELLVTAAAHSPAALRRADRLSLDAAILSPVFPSRSASAGSPLGVLRAAAMATAVRLPVYALGGVQARSSRRLAGTHLAGLAAVEALSR